MKLLQNVLFHFLTLLWGDDWNISRPTDTITQRTSTVWLVTPQPNRVRCWKWRTLAWIMMKLSVNVPFDSPANLSEVWWKISRWRETTTLRICGYPTVEVAGVCYSCANRMKCWRWWNAWCVLMNLSWEVTFYFLTFIWSLKSKGNIRTNRYLEEIDTWNKQILGR